MSAEIQPYNDGLVEKFDREAKRIRSALDENVTIEHVGSSAVRIGGKNIVDILIGVQDYSAGLDIGVKLLTIGYHLGNISEDDRIFMTSRKEETQTGDYHIHICARDSVGYANMLQFRNYLRENREVALEYEKMKMTFAREAGYDRKRYKELKGRHVEKLIRKMGEAF